MCIECVCLAYLPPAFSLPFPFLLFVSPPFAITIYFRGKIVTAETIKLLYLQQIFWEHKIFLEKVHTIDLNYYHHVFLTSQNVMQINVLTYICFSLDVMIHFYLISGPFMAIICWLQITVAVTNSIWKMQHNFDHDYCTCLSHGLHHLQSDLWFTKFYFHFILLIPLISKSR
jgi:hypothetical protein